MLTANLENSKKLFEVSAWDGLHKDGLSDDTQNLQRKVDGTFPLYDLSFLLDKLPAQIRLPYKNGRLRKYPNFLSLRPHRDYGNGYIYKPGWEAIYLKYRANDYISASADAPVDAACLLCILLFETNILKKGVN